MPLDPQQTLLLEDAQGRRLGRVSIDRIEGDRVFARFSADLEYSEVRGLFLQFEEAVNDQLFRDAERLADEIDRLGLRLTSQDATEQLAVRDVQIMNLSALNCRIPNLALTQFTRAVA